MTMLQKPLNLALRDLDAQRKRDYKNNLDFYEAKQWKGSPRLRERRITYNYAKAIIDKVSTYMMTDLELQVTDLTGQQGDGQEAVAVEKALSLAFEQNEIQLLDLEAEIDCAVLGDGAYKITWSKELDQILITTPDIQGIYAWRDAAGRLTRVAQQYQLPSDQAQLLYDYTPARKQTTITEDWYTTHWDLWVDDKLLATQPNPYKVIPYVVYPNLRKPKSPWGESDIIIIREACEELNREFSFLSAIMELSGAPITVLENISSSADIAVAPGAVWNIPEEAKAYLLDLLQGGGVSLHIDYLNSLYRTLHDLGEVPRTAFGDNQRSLSGVALNIELQPLLHRVSRKRLVREAAYRRRARLILEILDSVHQTNLAEQAARIQFIWGTVTPADPSQDATREIALVNSGLASRTAAMTRLGRQDPQAEFDQAIDEQAAFTTASSPAPGSIGGSLIDN